MADLAIKIENLKKRYRLGTIGGATLKAELQSRWARSRGKEDPNLMIGQEYSDKNETFWALNGINLEVHKGEALGIIGANGAGKSTLLKILSRVTAPTEGDIWIQGRIASMLEVGTGFHGELTGRENIYMNGAILGMSRKEVDAKIESIIDFSECRQFIDTPVKRYSSGMYVKLAFAVASHLDSEILVMDEVLAVGDMKFQKKCLGKMGDVAENEGRTVLYVSHNMATIRNLCTRCIVLDAGRIVYDGDVEEAIACYLQRETDELCSCYDLSCEDRVKPDFGKKIRINQLEFLGKEVPVYGQEEKIKFRIAVNSKLEAVNVNLFFQFFRSDNGNAVGGATSESFLVKEGDSRHEFEIVISNLAEGDYYFEVVALSFLPNGTHTTLDRIKRPVFFKVLIDDAIKTVKWDRNIYGCMVFPQMNYIREENHV